MSAVQVYMIKERCWFSQIVFFIRHFPHRINILFLSSQFYVIHTHRMRIILFRDEHRDILNLKFAPSHVSIRFSQIAFPNNSPAKRWPYSFRSRGTTGSSILDHDFGHLCRWIRPRCLSCAPWQSGDDRSKSGCLGCSGCSGCSGCFRVFQGVSGCFRVQVVLGFSVLDETVCGWKCHWMKPVLDESVFYRWYVGWGMRWL